MSKLMLVNPPDVSQGGVSNPILGLLYLASFIRNTISDIEVTYYDGFLGNWRDFESLLSARKPDFVGVQMLTPGRHQALRVAQIAKKYGATTILGGPHASIMADQIMNNYPFVDYIIQGEGEYALSMLVLKGYEYPIIRADKELPIDIIPYPAWDMAHLDSDRYIGNLDIRVPIIASRGCTGNCTFCSTHKFWKKYRVRSAENVVGEIEYIIKTFGKNHFVFEDDSLSCKIEGSKDILRLIIDQKLNIKFFATMRADGIDEELITLLKQAGCYGISIGFESGSPEVLKAYNKLITVEQNIQAAKIVKQSGLSLCALMIFNGIKSNAKTNAEITNFLNEIKPDDVGTLSELWVLPGTKIYELMKEHGFINDDFWLGPEPYYVYKGELDNIL